LTAGQVAGIVGGEVHGRPEIPLRDLAPVDRAGPTDLAFVTSPDRADTLARCAAGAVLVPPALATRDGPPTRIVVEDPRGAARTLLALFHPEPEPAWGVGHGVRLGRGVRWEGRLAVGDFACLGHEVRLGRDCVVGAHAILGDGVQLGDGCRVGPHAVLHPGSVLGDRVRVAAAACIGGAGFAYVSADTGHQPVPHVGRCVIEDDVDLGAHCVVDRGTLDQTVVGRGTKIDSQVKVAHNVRIGARCLIMAQTGIAGSAVVEDQALLAGQVGLADHARVGRGARVGAQGGVIGSVPEGATVSGYPARDHRSVLRQAAALKRLVPLVPSLEALVATHAGTE
jgi:UDP-3-O-[3-hydroxymyristoyl] glucosamine N-acyltransferase